MIAKNNLNFQKVSSELLTMTEIHGINRTMYGRTTLFETIWCAVDRKREDTKCRCKPSYSPATL